LTKEADNGASNGHLDAAAAILDFVKNSIELTLHNEKTGFQHMTCHEDDYKYLPFDLADVPRRVDTSRLC